MPQLNILSEEADAPILIATSNCNVIEHHEALNNGADFYGGYCDAPEQNINAVIASIKLDLNVRLTSMFCIRKRDTAFSNNIPFRLIFRFHTKLNLICKIIEISLYQYHRCPFISGTAG